MNVIDERPPFIRLKGLDIDKLFGSIKTPFYALDELTLINNGKVIKSICDKTNCKILLAQKAFSNYDLYPTLEPYISGTEASGLYEARLGKEEMPNKEVHVFCAGYREDEFEELLKYADHIVFNSLGQLKKFGPIAKAYKKEVGIRINPEFSTQVGHDIYDPCSKGSRLGIILDNLKDIDNETLKLIDGIHFHTLCQQNSDDLEKTIYAVEKKFGKYLRQMKWVNFGGGHHIVREDYDIPRLIKCINYAKETWGTEVYLEPGEGIVLNAGFLVSRVLDTFKNYDMNFLIHDCSAACHMPDVIEMPYLPPLYKADLDGNDILYRLGGPTCLTGDITGNYKFKNELKENDLLIFGDMALYTTCKNNTFNGMPLPDIYILHSDNSLEKLTNFGYMDFKYRLGKSK